MNRRTFLQHTGTAMAAALLTPRWARSASLPSAAGQPGSLVVTPEAFLLNGQPFHFHSGEMHFARIPREYWTHRLKMARAMGLNCVCAYLFWDVHEPRPGEFDFTGQADVAEFVRLAQAEGLHVILRPGPYACAEWDFGGLPSWLLQIPDLRVRCMDPRYIEAARRYLLRVGRELAPLQLSKGGPIILVQVENEYGSYGSDKEYLAFVRDTLRAAGFETPLFTCDGAKGLPHGTVDGVMPVVNFGSDPAGNIAALHAFSPHTPPACGEYYPGWFDTWGERHQTRPMDRLLSDVGWMLDHGVSFSIYMIHGGTTFGFRSGANFSNHYRPQVSSYDYDAPVDEAGRPTPKYHALRALLGKASAEPLPPIPPTPEVLPLDRITLTETASLFAQLPQPLHDVQPRPMEAYGQDHGLILYRTKLSPGAAAPLVVSELHDYGQVFLDGQLIGTIDRRLGQDRVNVPVRTHEVQLDLLVEAMGRVNYGPHLLDRKGITERVEFSVPYPGVLMGWEVFGLPLDAEQIETLPFKVAPASGPSFYRGTFEVSAPHDTFLDLGGWNKGYVWVNGHNLGRFWQIGPQRTLYVPGCWMRPGRNTIVAFDFAPPASASVVGLAQPILDAPVPDATGAKA